MPALRAARVENEIVKVPENKIAVAFGRPKALVPGRANLEKDVAVDKQAENLEPGEGSEILNNAPASGDSKIR